MPQNGHGWSDGLTEPCTGGKRVFQALERRADGRMDGQPENIMPPAPKGRGIKSVTERQTDSGTDGQKDGQKEVFLELLGRS